MSKLFYALSALPIAAALPAEAQLTLPQGTSIAAPAEPGVIPLYGDKTPGTRGSENWADFEGIGAAVRNVTYPTLTPVFPKGRANGAAVIVAPGGGYMMLAMEQEGWKIAQALAAKGITASS